LSRHLRATILVLLGVGVLIGLFAGARWAFTTLRYPITVASPANYSFSEFAAKVTRVLSDERPHARLERLSVPGLEEAATAMETGKADLAVIRTDLQLPPNGRTIAIIGRDPAFLIVPQGSNIASFRDLKGKSIAILQTGIDESRLLDRLLEFYAVQPTGVARTVMNASDIGEAMRQQKIAAVFAVASPNGKLAIDAFAAVAKAKKATPNIVGVAESEAVAKRFGNVEDGEIAAGAFAGANPRPPENVSTVIVVYRLMAKETMPDLVVGELTRLLMLARTRMLGQSPIAQRIQEPDADTDTVPMHPGAKAYYNDEQGSLFDKVQNVVYAAGAILSVVGSMIAWLVARFRKPGPGPAEFGERLMAILRKSRVSTLEELEPLEHELDDVVETLVSQRDAEQFGSEERAMLTFAVSQVRDAIRKRRDALMAAPPAAAETVQ
jgi:TRAP-type uncharacterized transport system substrate-binding protein